MKRCRDANHSHPAKPNNAGDDKSICLHRFVLACGMWQSDRSAHVAHMLYTENSYDETRKK
jgi:hypothetical protein